MQASPGELWVPSERGSRIEQPTRPAIPSQMMVEHKAELLLELLRSLLKPGWLSPT